MRDVGSEQPGGTVIRGPDGALYFIRDEMLENFRLPEKLAKDAETLVSRQSGRGDPEVNKEIERFTLAREPQWEAIAHVEGPLNEAEDFDINAVSRVASTVMCPSFLFEPGGSIE
jgi:hypothetical protein